MKIRIIAAVLLLFCFGMAEAHDFSVMIEGQKVYFSIKSQKERTVEVTYRGSIADRTPVEFEGELTLPQAVKWKDTTYRVAGISPKAFSGNGKLTGIVLPSGMTEIGAFAFEGCTSLSKVVFPGNKVAFGQGVFFGCTALTSLSFGSEWNEVDLQMFRWSEALRAISIPAKMTRIRNLKSLRFLESVTVDANNSHFSSEGGLLYNADGSVLYGCPRGYAGKVKIKESAVSVTQGALIDCAEITSVIVPTGMKSFSFREFSRMKKLSSIVFKGEVPVMTAHVGAKEVFLIQTASPEVKIVVGKQCRKLFAEALVAESGEYCEIGSEIPVEVNAYTMPSKSNVRGVKDFKDYE